METNEIKSNSLSSGAAPGSKRAPFPSFFPPMLASLAEGAFSRDGWIYEPKMDGMRCIAFVNGQNVKLLSRRGQNITAQYPALAAALPKLCKVPMVLDGEIIALNEKGKPSFQLLQQRMNLLKVSDIERAEARIPVHYFVFDTVYAGELNLSRCPLLERKKLLDENLQQGSGVAVIKYFEIDGKIAYQACIENGFEGIVAKRKDSPYEVGRRSPYWIKVKGQKSSEFVIAGYSAGQGSRSSTFGSLLLGYYNDAGKLIYAGSVGSGFDERLLADLMRRMTPLQDLACPFLKKPEDKKDAIWLRAELVAEIKFMDWTDDKHLRNPVFLHLRHDIKPEDVKIIEAIAECQLEAGAPGVAVDVPVEKPLALNANDHDASPTVPVIDVPVETAISSNAISHDASASATVPAIDESSRATSVPLANGLDLSPPSVTDWKPAGSQTVDVNEQGEFDASRRQVLPESLNNTLVSAGQLPLSAQAALSEKLSDLDLEIQHWQNEAQAVIAQLGGREKNMSVTVDHATISLTNLDKILFPANSGAASITKREYLKLVAFLSPYLLTHLQNRPLTMIRAPSGMRSRSFYQKHWNLDIPDFIETVRTELDDPTRKDQLLCNNIAALIFLAQHNILEYHCWLSRLPSARDRIYDSNGNVDLATLELPDYMAFDIDFHKEGEKDSDGFDKDAFAKSVEAAFQLHEILDQIGLTSFLKTSGRNGLHVFIPIKRDLKFEGVRVLAETIAKHAEMKCPALISTSAVPARKSGKVFLDYQANTRGKTIATPYTPRLTPNATISTPIDWSELGSVNPTEFNQHTIKNRLSSKKDIWKDMLSNPEDLSKRFSTNGKI